MENTKIAIVCNGREISYGMNLLHLTRYQDEETEFTSERYRETDVAIYSAEVYMHSKMAPGTVSVFIGNIQSVDGSMHKVFDQYGMVVWRDERNIIVKASAEILCGETYTRFLKFANRKRNEYIETEKDYVRKATERNSEWIAPVFQEITSGGMFGYSKVVKKKMQQQFDCMAFILYFGE